MTKKEYAINLKNNVVDIKAMPWDSKVIKKIATCRMLPVDQIKPLLKYNVMTFRQLSIITGVTESRIRNACIKSQKKGGALTARLTICNPFPDDSAGKLFVLVDEKCKDYIYKSISQFPDEED